MPAKPTWLLRLPEILDALEHLQVPVVDRAICERLFGIRRRRAIDLLQNFGGYQAGRTYLLDRRELIARLRLMVEDPSFAFECRRKQRLAAQLDELHKYRTAVGVRIPVAAAEARRPLPGLPEGVSLSAGMLCVTYADTEQLLSRLYELARAAADDYQAFHALAEAAAVRAA